jgi:3-deoxy-manno-octulosonate cytidylyltransferase (CMP-KDO synthetase)
LKFDLLAPLLVSNGKQKGRRQLMKVIGVIPARYHSTRLEGKPLADIHGRPMIQWVYENVKKARNLDDVIVATDDVRIREAVEGFGGKAVMTSRDHTTGTDRIAEVVADMDVEIVVNIQGDEPFVSPAMINEVAAPLLADRRVPMSTLMHEIDDAESGNPNTVKVVTDTDGFALYFSRAPIPYPRNRREQPIYGHIGIYGYRREFLLNLTRIAPTPLEKTESLEQLRVIENGFKIKVVQIASTDYIPLSVDTGEDLELARELLSGQRSY